MTVQKESTNIRQQVIWKAIADYCTGKEKNYLVIKTTTYIIQEGSLRLLTSSLSSNFSFFLLEKVVRTCLKLSCVGRISHHGESGKYKKMYYKPYMKQA